MAAKVEAILCCIIVFSYAKAVQSAEETSSEKSAAAVSSTCATYTGCGDILAKMEYLGYKFMELEFGVKEQSELLVRNQDRLDRTHEGMSWMLTRLEQAVGHNLTEVLDKSWEILQLQKSCSNHKNLRDALVEKKPAKASFSYFMKPEPTSKSTNVIIRSCKDEPTKISGKYVIQPVAEGETFNGYCEQAKFGGGWLVIQHRYNGLVDFNLTWKDYKDGFGNVEGEFWLGLERIHQLTKGKKFELMVELEDASGTHKYAKYEGFEIENEAAKYALKNIGKYSGTAGDAMNYSKGAKFSTRDNDSTSGCLSSKMGPWWHISCTYSNLNGPYMGQIDGQKTMHWYQFNTKYENLKYSRMMIREM